MRIEQNQWTEKAGWEQGAPGGLGDKAQIVLVFGAREAIKNEALLREIRAAFPKAHLMGCSTAGEIRDTRVTDDSLTITAVQFEHTEILGRSIRLKEAGSSFKAGEALSRALQPEGLIHVFVLSDGLEVNGSELVQGLLTHLPPHVAVTGGLSGDGARFQETHVLWNGGSAERGAVAVLGLYGKRLRVGYGSLGGWDAFGPERLITESKGNILYKLNGASALVLYKKYLGEHANGLPATGLLFPLSLRVKKGERGVVRTILGVNEADQSMTFAGDIPQGAHAQLMKANFDRLIDGACGAARTSYEAIGSCQPDLAILISCVGRKLILGQRIEEEIEGVREVLGQGAILTGFYSYGEISPFTPGAKCELHNQTMTITTFSER